MAYFLGPPCILYTDQVRVAGGRRDTSRDRRRALPRAPIHRRRITDHTDEEATSAIRDVTTEIARMTSSVNNIESDPTDRAWWNSRGSTVRRSESGVKSTTIQTAANIVNRLTMSTDNLSAASSSSVQGIRERLDEQKRKKMDDRRRSPGAQSTSLLAQIQDDLQSEIRRYTAELDASSKPRSVVCEEDPEKSPVETGKITNTALIDSQVPVRKLSTVRESVFVIEIFCLPAGVELLSLPIYPIFSLLQFAIPCSYVTNDADSM